MSSSHLNIVVCFASSVNFVYPNPNAFVIVKICLENQTKALTLEDIVAYLNYKHTIETCMVTFWNFDVFVRTCSTITFYNSRFRQISSSYKSY